MALSLIEIDDKEIIEAIKAKYNYHVQHSLKYKSMLDAYDKSFTAPEKGLKIKSSDTSQEIVFKEISEQEKKSKGTFESIVLDILSDGQPRLVSELNEDYFKITNKRLKIKDFSSKLSIRAKFGNRIKNIKFNDFPLEKRFWWAKLDWFDGNLLKPEYVNKIHAKFKNMQK
jgi:hypothetical protein